MFRSIRWRLVLSYVLLTLLTVGLVGVLALSLIRRHIERQETEYLSANAEAVARQARHLVWPMVRPHELRELAQTAAFLGNARVRIFDAQGQVLADSGPRAEGDAFVWITLPSQMRIGVPGEPSRFLIVALPSGRQLPVPIPREEPFLTFEQLPSDTGVTFVRRWDGMWGSRFIFHTTQESEASLTVGLTGERITPRSEQVISVPIGEAAQPLGYVEIRNGPDLSVEALTTTRKAFALAAAGATLLAALVGLLVSRGLSAPMRELTAVAGCMSQGDLSIRAPVRGKDEIGQLAGQFNHMAERLEATFTELAAERDALRRFITDASHELRTPITALKNFNDLLQGAAAEDPTAHTEFLAESQIQIERLEWITRHLLDLSRLDAGLVALDVAQHDVGELIEASVSAFKGLAQEKGIELSVRLPAPPLQVRCDRARIGLALSNLLDNAFKFTPTGGQVEIGAESRGERVRLWVRDTGCGIGPEEQPRIFQRFYRGRSTRTEGSGLGLAIVKSVVLAHGGQVSVESEPGAGSLFAIDLPR